MQRCSLEQELAVVAQLPGRAALHAGCKLPSRLVGGVNNPLMTERELSDPQTDCLTLPDVLSACPLASKICPQ